MASYEELAVLVAERRARPLAAIAVVAVAHGSLLWAPLPDGPLAVLLESDPHAEYAEWGWKLRPMLSALGAKP